MIDEVARKVAMDAYDVWLERVSDKQFADMFAGQPWIVWKGAYTRKSICGNYRLVILNDRVKVYEY